MRFRDRCHRYELAPNVSAVLCRIPGTPTVCAVFRFVGVGETTVPIPGSERLLEWLVDHGWIADVPEYGDLDEETIDPLRARYGLDLDLTVGSRHTVLRVEWVGDPTMPADLCGRLPDAVRLDAAALARARRETLEWLGGEIRRVDAEATIRRTLRRLIEPDVAGARRQLAALAALDDPAPFVGRCLADLARAPVALYIAGDLDETVLDRLLPPARREGREAAVTMPPSPYPEGTVTVHGDWREDHVCFVLPVRPPADLPTQAALRLAFEVLVGGGSISSLLGRSIRVEGGLAYGVGARLLARDGPWEMCGRVVCRTGDAERVIERIRTTLDAFTAGQIDAAMLAATRATVIDGLRTTVEHPDDLVSTVAHLDRCGVPVDAIDDYAAALETVTPEDVAAQAAIMFPQAPLFVVACGRDASEADGAV